MRISDWSSDVCSSDLDRISTTSVPLIEPAHVVALPKGQCFALIEGGNLWKVRMPLPAPDSDEAMPKDLQELAGYTRQHYVEAGDWRENQGIPGLQDKALDRKSGVQGRSVPVRVDLGGGRSIKKKKKQLQRQSYTHGSE